MIPSSPPPEVLEAVQEAAKVAFQLDAQGRHVRFAVDRPTGQLTIGLHDASGWRISRLSPTDVVRLPEAAAWSNPH
ncbi:MAG: hypothetical protein ACYDHH_07730 [Solirubrobacteraceae bacterium]